MNRTVRLLFFVLMTACLNYPAPNKAATPSIDIDFENHRVTGLESIHARAKFYSYGTEIRTILTAIADYPELHAWIDNATLLRQVSRRKLEYRIEFDFPWPVGRRWSRVEVHHENPTKISWYQIEGNLKMNQGEITIVTCDERVEIEYQAILDVGLPDAWTRNYKKKFVTDFLNATYDQARTSQTATGLALASTGP